jgi:Cys-rich repeat protein
MAEGAGFANFRSASIDMPAHSDNCKRTGTCAWQSMSVGGNQPANKLDLGYWFEQLAAIGRASPADGDGWAHSRRGYAHFRRGGWQYDPASPDWPGSWTNHRHAWEGSACKLYKVINPAQGTVEAMGDDKAICVFAGQSVTDPHANPGAPTADPSVMLWPYDNEHAEWDPELTRPTGVECTQNAQCASGTCEAGKCK